MKWWIVGLLIILVAAGMPEAITATDSAAVEKKFTSMVGIEYSASFDPTTHRLSIEVENPQGRSFSTGYRIIVDKKTVYDTDFTIAPGHRKQRDFNISRNLSILSPDHEIIVSTYGGSATFQFQQKLDRSYGTYPYFTDVEMGSKQIGPRNYSAVNVTIRNPGPRSYLLRVVAYTLNTSGYYSSIFVPANGSGTASVPLEEGFDDPVAGELRLYRGNISDAEDGIDQVEFTSEREGETAFQRQAYEPITPPWEPNPYEYENETFEDRHDGLPEPLHAPKAYAAGLIAFALAVGWAWRRRRRRKWR